MGRIKKVDHVGIAVSNMKEAIGIYKTLIFKEPFRLEHINGSKVELAFFNVGEVHIELLAPTASESWITAFLDEKGDGVHHICYEVEGIAEILQDLKRKEVKLIDENPRPGSRGSQVAFVDSMGTIGVYIEYCEFPETKS
jgi:methylmalonyl-CoA epimerase